jgi:hypothetical protein
MGVERRLQASKLAYSAKLQGLDTRKQLQQVVQVRQTGERGVGPPVSTNPSLESKAASSSKIGS